MKINLDKKDIKDSKLFSGMYVNVQLPNSNQTTTQEKIMVPKSAIIHQGQLSGIYTVDDNQTALLRWVRLGNDNGNQVEILSGLTAGEQYVIESESRLLNGVKVEL